MDNVEVGDAFEEDIDGEGDTRFSGDGVPERVSLQKYKEQIEDCLEPLSGLEQFEDDDERKEMLTKFRDNVGREKTFLKNDKDGEETENTSCAFWDGYFRIELALRRNMA